MRFFWLLLLSLGVGDTPSKRSFKWDTIIQKMAQSLSFSTFPACSQGSWTRFGVNQVVVVVKVGKIRYLSSMDIYHVGSIFPRRYFYLIKSKPSLFQWFNVSSSFEMEKEAICSGETPAKAIFAAHKKWDNDHFRLLHCGFRYSQPIRDETGCNAFFWEMAKSYSSPNGNYFDEELGHLCYVDFASQEALSIWRKV